jgi:hypothetical protein
VRRWDRRSVESTLRHRLWSYLTGDAIRSHLPGSVEDIWQLERGELRRLTCAHLATAPDADKMLDSARRLLRTLPSSLSPAETVLHGTVHGPVAWQPTRQLRLRTNDPTVFVCRPPERRFDSPLARLVKLALTTLIHAGDEASDLTGRGETAIRRTTNIATARDLLAHRKLVDVPVVDSIPTRTLSALRRRADAGPCIAYVEAARSALNDVDPRAIADVLSSQLLVPATDDTLYELLTGFSIIDAFTAHGFDPSRTSALRGTRRPFAVLHRADQQVTIWWQRAVNDLYPALAPRSTYSRTLAAAGMTGSSLRPDFIVDIGAAVNGPSLVVEVKHTTQGDHTPERRGIVDAMAYLEDSREHLAGKQPPHALVVAWNASGRPAVAPIMVSDEEHLGQAINIALGATPTAT